MRKPTHVPRLWPTGLHLNERGMPRYAPVVLTNRGAGYGETLLVPWADWRMMLSADYDYANRKKFNR